MEMDLEMDLRRRHSESGDDEAVMIFKTLPIAAGGIKRFRWRQAVYLSVALLSGRLRQKLAYVSYGNEEAIFLSALADDKHRVLAVTGCERLEDLLSDYHDFDDNET